MVTRFRLFTRFTLPVRDERALKAVPYWVWALFIGSLSAQLVWSTLQSPPHARAQDLPMPPTLNVLRAASLGENAALGKLVMLWLQAFDYQAGTRVPFRQLDYDRLIAWLDRVVSLDPAGQYPLLTAARIYAEISDPPKQRSMLAFLSRRFAEAPNERWPWLAHATVIAKHQLKDLSLALTYAGQIREHATGPSVPHWARQMEAFILEDMNELEAAKVLIGGLLASGQIRDSRDQELLERRLRLLEQRISESSPK